MSSRIGTGPWARALGAALVPDDSTPEAIRGEELWRQGAVEDLRIETGQIAAVVDGCTVTITSATIPPRIWDAMVNYSRNRGPLEQAVRGTLQSVQLAHLLAQDWDEPLVPNVDALVEACSCDAQPACAHISAAAYAAAAAIDAEPASLLRWRVHQGVDVARETPGAVDDPAQWIGTAVPVGKDDATRRSESVLRRLGSAGVQVAGCDLASVLVAAYEALTPSRPP